MISDTINDYTLLIPTLPVPSAYHIKYDATTSIPKYTLNKAPLLITKLISKERDKPCYKTSIKNIKKLLSKNNIYKDSLKKDLIEENLNRSFCGFGVSKKSSKESIMNKIKDSILIYGKLNTEEKNNLNNMNKIFFTVLREIDDRLS